MRPCENVNFCLFCECAFLDSSDYCSREACVLDITIVRWWEMSLQPYPLIRSNPPEGMRKTSNIYYDPELKKVVVEKEV